MSASAINHFQELVDGTVNRFQCINHSTVTSLRKILYTVANNSNSGVGGIIYAVLSNFAEVLSSSYLFWIYAVRVSVLAGSGNMHHVFNRNMNSF